MIRINLLELPEAQTSVSKPKMNFGRPAELAAAALVLLAVVYVGARWYSLNHQIGTLNAGLKQADEELKELQDALDMIEVHTTRKAQLAQQVDIISNLKRSQKIPVHLLDQLSEELPDFLWLEGLEESKGRVVLNGKATTYNAVSNFYNNLTESPIFTEVTLGTTRKVPEGVSFHLNCRFVPSDEMLGATTADAADAPPRG